MHPPSRGVGSPKNCNAKPTATFAPCAARHVLIAFFVDGDQHHFPPQRRLRFYRNYRSTARLRISIPGRAVCVGKVGKRYKRVTSRRPRRLQAKHLRLLAVFCPIIVFFHPICLVCAELGVIPFALPISSLVVVKLRKGSAIVYRRWIGLCMMRTAISNLSMAGMSSVRRRRGITSSVSGTPSRCRSTADVLQSTSSSFSRTTARTTSTISDSTTSSPAPTTRPA